MERKGQAEGVVGIIVTLITLSILIYTLVQSSIKDEEIKEIDCRNSVFMAHSAGLSGLDFKNSINCPYISITLDSPSKEQAMKEIANAMSTCWNNFYRGELDFFSESSSTFCIPCYHITISNVDWEISGEEFLEYLKENKVPGTGTSYLEYLTNQMKSEKFDELPDELKKGFNFSINESNYIIMFTENKFGYTEKRIAASVEMAFIGGISAAATAAFVASTGPVGFILSATTAAKVGGFAGWFSGAMFGATTGWEPFNIAETERIPGIFVLKYDESEEGINNAVEVLNNLGCEFPFRVS